eukprot:457863-Rhodomonas_salina.2
MVKDDANSSRRVFDPRDKSSLGVRVPKLPRCQPEPWRCVRGISTGKSGVNPNRDVELGQGSKPANTAFTVPVMWPLPWSVRVPWVGGKARESR